MPIIFQLLVLITIFTGHLYAKAIFESHGPIRIQKSFSDVEATEKTRKIITALVNRSFTELKDAKIEVKSFKSESSYFRSRFSVGRFLTLRKITYLIYVNPQVVKKSATDNGIEAIVAHELAHVL